MPASHTCYNLTKAPFLAAGALYAASPVLRPYESDGSLAATNSIDAFVLAKLREKGIESAKLCSDEVFARRVYLDAIGTLPTASEARAFLEDRKPDKRDALIDRLLAREEYADYWAMKWCNLLRVKSEFPINLWPNAVQAYHRWIRTSIKDNMPYDRFARELLTSSGSNFRTPQVNFYRAVQSKDPQSLAQAVALAFMGVRADQWPKDRLAGMAAFFAQVGYKTTAEWKEEIVFLDLGKANLPAMATFPDGKNVSLPPMQDAREIFADWLLSPGNPWFARSIVNRVWSWLLGRGIIHEPDDIRPDNPPVNPELLALLERELVANRYDLKHLFRLILKSKTYQLSCIPSSKHLQGEALFAWYPLRRMGAEVLIDAINQITGTKEKYTSLIPEPFTYIPEDVRSIALADASISSSFLELFGRSPRVTGLESEQRDSLPTAAQELHLLNSSHIRNKLEQSALLRVVLNSGRQPREIVNELYLTILSRYPTDEEFSAIIAYKQAAGSNKAIGLDIAWSLINSAEFQYRH